VRLPFALALIVVLGLGMVDASVRLVQQATAEEPAPSMTCTGEATGVVYKSVSDNTPLNLRITLTCR
jgi:hypothetical protein